jgi:hypothetical protein
VVAVGNDILLESVMKTISNYNFYDYSNVDYDEDFPCQNGSDCCYGDYCRCGVIENARVKSIPDVLNLFYSNESEINRYCIDRILTNFKIWNKELWDVNVCGGYYGQEIDSVTFSKSSEVDGHIGSLSSLVDIRSKVEYVLNLEYGFLLDSVKDKNWEFRDIHWSQLVFGNDNYRRKLDDNSYYDDYKLARGICLQSTSDNKEYKLIDGYHRLSKYLPSVRVIVGF